MRVTSEIIENELLSFFNPFVYIAVQEGKSKGGFDIKPVDAYDKESNSQYPEHKLHFIIFDKNWEDQDKVKVWEETYSIEEFKDLLELKSKLAPHIEKSIRIFCD